jgi:hypothetical protein
MRSHSGFIPLMRACSVLAMRSYACADASCSVFSLIIHARARSDLLQNDRERICHLRIASVAPLRAGTETDAESPVLDSAHGSQRLSAPALSAGSQRWLSAHGLSAWLQRVSLSAGSQRVALMMTGQRRREDERK